jgi:hypothetical protein
MRGRLRRLHGARLHGARLDSRVHVPAEPSRPPDKPRKKRHGENDRQGSEENATDDAHASKHIGSRRTRPAC